MNLENYTDYACFDYDSVECPLHRLGDVVINKDKEVGVIIQVHGNEEYRVDMFGNCHVDEIKMASDYQIKRYRPNLLNEGHFKPNHKKGL